MYLRLKERRVLEFFASAALTTSLNWIKAKGMPYQWWFGRSTVFLGHQFVVWNCYTRVNSNLNLIITVRRCLYLVLICTRPKTGTLNLSVCWQLQKLSRPCSSFNWDEVALQEHTKWADVDSLLIPVQYLFTSKRPDSFRASNFCCFY